MRHIDMVGQSGGPAEHGQQAGLGVGLGGDRRPLGDRARRAIRVLLDDELVGGEIDQLGSSLVSAPIAVARSHACTTWSKINWVR